MISKNIFPFALDQDLWVTSQKFVSRMFMKGKIFRKFTAMQYLFNSSNSYCCLPLAGRFCEHEETENSAEVAEDCDSELQEYLDTLELRCDGDESEAATLTWTPDFETPNVVYYQVSTVSCRSTPDLLYEQLNC